MEKKEEIPYTASQFPYFLPEYLIEPSLTHFISKYFAKKWKSPDQWKTFIHEFRWRLWPWTGLADLALPLHFKKFNINPFPEPKH